MKGIVPTRVLVPTTAARDAVGRAIVPSVRADSRVTLAALLGLVYLICLATNIVTLLSPPRLSLTLSVAAGEARVGSLVPGGILWEGGVRPGDRVLTMDHRAPGPHEGGRWTGESLLVQTAPGAMKAFSAGDVRQGHETWPLLLLSPWFILLGTLVFLRAPQPAVGRVTYALFASAAFALALAPGAVHDRPLEAALEWCMIALFPVCFLLFFLTFPVAHGGTRLRSALVVSTVGVMVLSLAALVWPVLYAPGALLRLGNMLLCLLVGTGLVVHAFATVRDRDLRRGLTIVSAGTAASVLPFLVFYLGPVLLGAQPLLAAEQSVLPLGLLPAGFAYAILRHDILSVPLIQRWLVHGLLWSGVLLPYALIISAENWLLQSIPEPGRSLLSAAILVLLVGVTFGWLRDRLKAALDRLIFKDSYDYRSSLQALSRDLSIAGGLDTLAESLPDRLRRLMNLEFAALLIDGPEGPQTQGAAGTYQSAMQPALVAAARGVREMPKVVPLAYGYIHTLFVPLRLQESVIGHICLGPKGSGEPFRAEDRDLLTTLSGQLAAVVRTWQLVADLKASVATLDALNERLQHAQEEERAHLAAEIHDEPLQTAIHIQRQLAATEAQNRERREHLRLMAGLIDQLRRVCAAIRPPALDDLGLQAALDALASEQGDRAGVPVALEVAPEMADIALAPEDELVLYRAAQEAVNNCLRHARPGSIRIELGAQDSTVEICVRDDGLGFEVPARFDSLAADGHLGLAGLQERVQRAGGRLSVRSAPGQGTAVEATLPLRSVRE